MNDKIEQAKGLFSWIEDKVATPIGAGLLSVIVTSLGWYVFNESLIKSHNSQITMLVSQVDFYKSEFKKSETEVDILTDRLAISDQDCANRFIFMNNAIKQLEKGTQQARDVSEKLSEQEKKSAKELKDINNKIKSKL